MKALFVAIISMTLLLSTFTLTESFAANPNDSNSVYLIKTHDQGLKNVFGVRHNFDVGFTTFLNEHQAAALERAGFGIETVPAYDITKAPEKCTPWPTCKNGGGDDGGSDPTRPNTPSTQIPWGIDKIYRDAVPQVIPSGGNNIKVAVLDTGVNKNHLDLKNNIIDCKDFTKGPRVKNTCTDDNGHGTHVAGTILADGGTDRMGIYGVAPGASLMAYKVCASTCWTDDIAAAIDYAGSHEANIISMSLGGDSKSSLISAAIDRNSHVLIIAAAGNDGDDNRDGLSDGPGTIDYPAANKKVVAVGAIDINSMVPVWSSLGLTIVSSNSPVQERQVELAAPGVSVYSAWNDGSYNTISGTSMSTPHVSGLAAKVWDKDAQTTRGILHDLSSDIWPDGDDTATGFGLPQVP